MHATSRDVKTTVLFACVHNAGRSQMAAAFFRAEADPSKATAVSAGTDPAERVHRVVVDAMREIGIDLSQSRPRLLTPKLGAEAQVLVTMGCGAQCPHLPGVEREDWELDDPTDEPIERVRAIRDEIRARVSRLIARRGWVP
jgi:arsenate reductase